MQINKEIEAQSINSLIRQIPSSIIYRNYQNNPIAFKLPEQPSKIAHLSCRRKKKVKFHNQNQNNHHKEDPIGFKESKKTKSQLNIKKIMKNQKINALIQNFKGKIKRKVVRNHSAVEQEFEINQYERKQRQCNIIGLQLKYVQSLMDSCFMICYVLSFFLYGIMLSFDNIGNQNFIAAFKVTNFIVLFSQIVLTSICQKNIGDRHLQYLSQIWSQYLTSSFPIDIFCLSILAIDMSIEWEGIKILRLCYFLRTKQFFRKLAIFQNWFVNNFQREQYWGVIKVFSINFLMAHLIGVILLLIADGDESWMSTIGILNNPWNEQYAYAYFWAMSTMLGFGNATPSNHREAILISIIQCVSCIFFAYIINQVGNLLTNITNKNQEKQKNLQTIRRLTQQNKISDDLHSKISNYIRQTDSIDKKFNLQSDRLFVNSLPVYLKREFLKESNKKIFFDLSFFSSLTQKSLIKLAEIITIKIAHPQQIIFHHKDAFKFIILKKGEVGFCGQKRGNKLKKLPIDVLKVRKKECPKLLSLKIFQNSEQQIEQVIKSLDFSVLYELPLDDVLKVLKENNCDYQKFCQIRDQSKHILDFYQTIQCKHCETNHSKMKCPRLHYIPLKILTISRYLKKVNEGKNARRKQFKRQSNIFKPLLQYGEKLLNIQKLIYGDKKQKSIKIRTKSINKKQASISNILEESFCDRPSFCSDLSFKGSKKKIQVEYSFLQKMRTQIDHKINGILNKPSYFDIQNSLWDEKVDSLHNFKFYFCHYNACQLKDLCLKDENLWDQRRKVSKLNSDDGILIQQ